MFIIAGHFSTRNITPLGFPASPAIMTPFRADSCALFTSAAPLVPPAPGRHFVHLPRSCYRERSALRVPRDGCGNLDDFIMIPGTRPFAFSKLLRSIFAAETQELTRPWTYFPPCIDWPTSLEMTMVLFT